MRMRLAFGALCALGLSLALTIDGKSVIAATACDFLTGGGYIKPEPAVGNKANFAVAGGCKHGSFWGHLQYQDKLVTVKVHSITITGYQIADDVNARLICGTGQSDDGGNVDFRVRAKEAGEPGTDDEFDVQITKTMGGALVYTTFVAGVYHKVIGGNVQLHKPNASNTGDFGGTCPAIVSGGGGGPFTLTVTLASQSDASGNVTSTPPPIACTLVVSPPSAPTQTGVCSGPFAAGSTVTLRAFGNAGASASFSANCAPVTPDSGAAAQCEIVMTMDDTVTVTFLPPE
jgi:hypothetical protein